ncbi:MAG: CRISPR system Cmr subunit Cmr5 [Verrucomicrobia subdivision 3 bacterium]|nr:CRISPR system Cmr subunit Cmr5 [Limisphaerales bacterium]
MPENSVPAATLEQQRAKHAWEKSNGCSKEYTNLAKGLPALIMNSGLMQVMAYLNEKGKDEHKRLLDDLCDWLNQRKNLPKGFKRCMEALLKAEPREFQEITTEAMAWLRWMRQMAAARQPGKGND